LFEREAKTPPDSLALIFGDAIQNLMTALDHLAYQVICSETASDPPPRAHRIHFRVQSSKEAYDQEKLRKLPGASSKAVELFDALKSYKGAMIHSGNSSNSTGSRSIGFC
jgi:hypothetical protein